MDGFSDYWAAKLSREDNSWSERAEESTSPINPFAKFINEVRVTGPRNQEKLRVRFNDKNLMTIREYNETEMEFWPEPCPSTDDYKSPLGSECDEACMSLRESMKEDFPELAVTHGVEKNLETGDVHPAIWLTETEPNFSQSSVQNQGKTSRRLVSVGDNDEGSEQLIINLVNVLKEEITKQRHILKPEMDMELLVPEGSSRLLRITLWPKLPISPSKSSVTLQLEKSSSSSQLNRPLSQFPSFMEVEPIQESRKTSFLVPSTPDASSLSLQPGDSDFSGTPTYGPHHVGMTSLQNIGRKCHGTLGDTLELNDSVSENLPDVNLDFDVNLDPEFGFQSVEDMWSPKMDKPRNVTRKNLSETELGSSKMSTGTGFTNSAGDSRSDSSLTCSKSSRTGTSALSSFDSSDTGSAEVGYPSEAGEKFLKINVAGNTNGEKTSRGQRRSFKFFIQASGGTISGDLEGRRNKGFQISHPETPTKGEIAELRDIELQISQPEHWKPSAPLYSITTEIPSLSKANVPVLSLEGYKKNQVCVKSPTSNGTTEETQASHILMDSLTLEVDKSQEGQDVNKEAEGLTKSCISEIMRALKPLLPQNYEKNLKGYVKTVSEDSELETWRSLDDSDHTQKCVVEPSLCEIGIEPREKFVFNAPFSVQNRYLLRIRNKGLGKVGWALKSNQPIRFIFSQGSGILEHGKHVDIEVTCDAFNYEEEKTERDRVSVEWVGLPQDFSEKKLNRDIFLKTEIVYRKNLRVIYNP